MKSILGKLVRNSFAASLGVNDDWSAGLYVLAIVELILMIGTLLVKVSLFSSLLSPNRSRLMDILFLTITLRTLSKENKMITRKDNKKKLSHSHGLKLNSGIGGEGEGPRN